MRITQSQSLKLGLVPLGLALACASARADFNPIALAPGSFTQDVVVESNAVLTVPPINAFVNMTMDGGTNKVNNTWYERGYNTGNLTHGLPPHGSTLVSVSDPTGGHVYQMPPTYATNCAIMVGHNNGSGTALLPNGSLTVTTPTAFLAISVLGASGNGPVPVQLTVHHADSSTETFSYTCLDWFNNAANVTNSAGRINVSGGGFANEGGNPAGALFSSDFNLANSGSPITSIDFSYAGSNYNNGRACIFALSGSTDGATYVPVPVSGFNADPVVEVGATPNTGLPPGLTTATMDGGTNNTGFTWYEQGYYTNDLTTGLPPAGSTITSYQLPSAHYALPPSWVGNNAAMLDQSNPVANLTLSAPDSYGALSFLVASGNGDNILPCIIQHVDGTSETNALVAFDWFKTSVPWAFQSRGAGVSHVNCGINNLPEMTYQPPLDPRSTVAFPRRLFDSVVMLSNSSAVTNVMLVRTNGTSSNSRTVVFAVSGSPVGTAVAPFFALQSDQPDGAGLLDPVNFTTAKSWAGTNIVLAVGTNAISVLGTPPFSYQWKAAPRGGGARAVFDYSTFVNLADDGTNIVGSSTSMLILSNAIPANSADYLVVISNAGGSVTSAVATVQVFATNILDIPVPGDSISSFGGTEPAAETVNHAIDDLVGNDPGKWLNFGANFGGAGLPFVGPVGFIVQPSQGASILSGLRLYTANDTTGRDPDDIMVEGSNDGASWTMIYSNGLAGTMAMPLNRTGGASTALNPLTQNVDQLLFNNAASYSFYRVTIANTENPLQVNSMQIGEIEMLGVLSPAAPTITAQPQNEKIYAGGSATFSVTAVGPPPLSYQWYNTGTAVASATNSSYTFPNAELGDSGRTFTCTVTNVYGSTPSSSATLTVVAVPTNPYPSVVMADAPLAYWRLDETAPGGSADGIVANDFAGGHNGIYHAVEVDDGTGTLVPGFNPLEDPDTAASFGSAVSVASDSYVGNIANLNLAATNGSHAAFSVETWVKSSAVQTSDAGVLTKGFGGGGEQFNLDFGGSDPAHNIRFYFRDGTAAVNAPVHAAVGTTNLSDGQWHHVVGVVDEVNGNVKLYVDGVQNGTVATVGAVGVMNSTFPVSIGSRTAAAGATSYTLQYGGNIDDTAIYGYALTATQVLNHFYAAQLPPRFTAMPTNTLAGEHGNATFFSSAYGPPPVTYQWYQSTDGVTFNPVPGATNANYTITNVAATANGNLFQVVANDPFGSVTSAPPALLTVASGAPFVINDLPQNAFVLAGTTLNLEADFGGSAPIFYQWQKNGTNVVNGGRISGATSNVLTIAFATAADTGNYQLFASNSTPPTASSGIEAVTVIPDVSFRTNGNLWVTNGNAAAIATFTNVNTLQLTFNKGSTATSAWFNNPVEIDNWTAKFIYQDATPGATHLNGGADGVSFCLQNDTRGTAALGGAGGQLGVSTITPSSEIELNIYPPNTPGMTYEINGIVPAAGSAGFAPTSPADIDTGHQIQFVLNYSINSGILSVNLTDLSTLATFSTNYNAGDLSAVLGGHTAFVGFTGADGGVTSIQYISNFVFLPPTPTLAAQLTAPNTLVLSWPASGGGYTLQSTPSLPTSGSPTWTNVTNTVNYNNGTNSVTITPVTGAAKFYRLTLPLQ